MKHVPGRGNSRLQASGVSRAWGVWPGRREEGGVAGEGHRGSWEGQWDWVLGPPDLALTGNEMGGVCGGRSDGISLPLLKDPSGCVLRVDHWGPGWKPAYSLLMGWSRLGAMEMRETLGSGCRANKTCLQIGCGVGEKDRIPGCAQLGGWSSGKQGEEGGQRAMFEVRERGFCCGRIYSRSRWN